MGDTNIEWTDKTWNCLRGCSRVSEGCRHCYAEGVAYRFSGPGGAYEGLVRIGSDGKRRREWNGTVRFVEEHLLDPLKWKEPKRVFVNSMSDLFHENVTNEMRDKIFAVMALCPQHTFQVLTKRPDRMLAYFNRPDRGNWSKVVTNPAAWLVWCEATKIQAASKRPIPSRFGWTTFDDVDTVAPWPLPNVHLGVSCENQETADERIPLLLQTPAAVRFISAEPLLGPINLSRFVWPTCWHWDAKYRRPEDASAAGAYAERKPQGLVWAGSKFLDWVIIGGESGPGARPMRTEWVESLVIQCREGLARCFVKQLGSHVIQWGERRIKRDKKGGDMHEWPHEIRVREFPKEATVGGAR